MKKEELQGILELHEQRMAKRAASKSKSDVVLHSRSTRENKGKKGSGSTTKVEEATIIRLVGETNKKEIRRTREDHHTKVTTEVVLQVEKDVVFKNLTKVTFSVLIVRSMVIILVIVLKNKRTKKMMQIVQRMKKKKCH